MTSGTPDIHDRLSARARPEGTPVMKQSWDKLLFLNWEIPVRAVRPLIPEPLKIDTFAGNAWLTVTPLTIWDAGPKYLPTVPYISRLHELNVRTYVYFDGVPGVWFFSLDANNLLAVEAARLLFCLPYFTADIELTIEKRVHFSSSRKDQKAEFEADWTIGDDLPSAEPGSLDFFLLERYCLYTADDGKIYRCRINHEPWPLQSPEDVSIGKTSVVAADGIQLPKTRPVVHCGGPVHVDVWPLEQVA
ncbi:MAG: YqjF family protein [Pyrinomonadaceae bacterium]